MSQSDTHADDGNSSEVFEGDGSDVEVTSDGTVRIGERFEPSRVTACMVVIPTGTRAEDNHVVLEKGSHAGTLWFNDSATAERCAETIQRRIDA